MSKDYYNILGVGKDASDLEIKSAYRKLAMKWHPDRCKEANAKEMFADISEAYSVLSDREKRERYDQFGSAEPDTGGFGGFGGFNPFEMFERMRRGGGGFDFGFGGFRQDSEPDFGGPEDGHDIQTNVSVSFKESVFGCVREFDLNLSEECPECGGTGVRKGTEPKKCGKCNGTGRHIETRRNGFMMSQTISACPECGGTGYSVDKCGKCGGSRRIAKKRHVKVKIPKGARSGMRLCVKGGGQCGVNGGADGDLYIFVEVKASQLFKRLDGNNIQTRVFISPVTSVLGGEAVVNTPYGEHRVEIKPGTATGARVAVPGCGIKTENGAGDLYADVVIEPYSKISDEQRALLDKLKAIEKPEDVKSAWEQSKLAEEFRS